MRIISFVLVVLTACNSGPQPAGRSSASLTLPHLPLAQAVCEQVIPFAQANGSEVSAVDLYHCHTILQLKEGEERAYSSSQNWKELEERQWGLICHAHEKDGKRVDDNFNLFHRHGESSFWGVNHPVNEKEVLERFQLPKERFLVTWTNIYFYPADSEVCPRLREVGYYSCGGKPICIGLESELHN